MANTAQATAVVMSELDRLAPAEAIQWRRRLQETARPCGCKSGATLSILALVSWPIWTFVSSPPQTLLEWVLTPVSYGLAVIASGLIGKVAGILVGRWRHRHLHEQLARRLARLALTAGGR
jgi:hypothetical protein